MRHSWKLMKGNEIVGVLSEKDVNMPFVNCEFISYPSYSLYEAKFAEELSLLNSDQMNEWERVYSEINALGFTLVSNNSKPESITEFILHIDGNQAWFSY